MDLLQVFLASSSSLKKQRDIIGDEIRKMSYQYECRGVRIRLNCWEDFAPEYIGTSKQEEYNGFLVAPSQLFIALISNRIGYYTEREIDVALKAISKENVHCICMPEECTAVEYLQVDKQLRDKGITSLNVYNDEQLIERVTQIIERYIEKNYNSENQDFTSSSLGIDAHIYATITEDVHNAGVVTREQFGNMIRSLDERLESDFGKRCYLYPYKVLDNITRADYYLSLLRDTYTKEEKDELFHAFKERPIQQKPICTFIRKGGKITSNHTELRELLRKTEAFSCEFDSLDTIKLTLFFYLYKTQSSFINERDKAFSLKNGRIYFLGNYLADVAGLKDYDALKDLEIELKSIEEQLSRPSANRFDLWNRKQSLEAKIMNVLLASLNEFLLSDRCLSDYDVSKDIDYKLAVEACRDEDSASEAYTLQNVSSKQKRIDFIISRIEYIRGLGDNDIEEEIANALFTLYVNVKSLTKLPMKSPDSVIQTMYYMVSLSDTYGIYQASDYNEDELYGLIVETADRYNLLSPKIEMMRINYANSFSRKLQHSTANMIYLKAVENIDKFDDTSHYIRCQICIAYTFAIEHFMEVNIHAAHVYRLLNSYQNKIDSWSRSGNPFYIGECMYLASKVKCLTEEDNLEEIIHEAETAYENVLNYSPLSPIHHLYGDIYCYLPNNIAGLCIDSFPHTELQKGRPAFEKAIKYCEIELNNARELEKIDEIHGKEFIAKAKHQLGFLLTKQQNLYYWKEVIPLYQSAYDIRKHIYNTTQSLSVEIEVAETATNIGGFIFQILDIFEEIQKTPLWDEIKDFVLANKYSFADEAVVIYLRNIAWGEEEKEMNYYKALQLKGSLLYVCAENSFPDGNREEGLELMRKAYEWNIQHPLNGYRSVFESVSGRYLSKEKLI